MGPYSERRQAHRRRAIEKILARPGLSDDARRIWTQHLSRLATNEHQYLARLQSVYSDLSFARNFGNDSN